jgi:hypothetical protein
MFQKGVNQPFFGMSAQAPRPLSEATEMFDTDIEDDDSDIQEDGEANSPRVSINSVCAHTLSLFQLFPSIVALLMILACVYSLVRRVTRLSHHTMSYKLQGRIISVHSPLSWKSRSRVPKVHIYSAPQLMLLLLLKTLSTFPCRH